MNIDDHVAIRTLKNLQAIQKESIVIYEFPHCSKICICGQNIEERFDSLDLPETEIIEY